MYRGVSKTCKRERFPHSCSGKGGFGCQHKEVQVRHLLTTDLCPVVLPPEAS